MRSTGDRIRHAISFEIVGLLIVIPLGTWVFNQPMHDMGVVAIAGTLLATGWNYLYNLLFDLGMLKWFGSVAKTFAIRVVHAVLFEIGLLLVMLPLVALYLGVSLWHALLIDGGFALFYMLYALVFNWAYDLVFPVPGLKKN